MPSASQRKGPRPGCAAAPPPAASCCRRPAGRGRRIGCCTPARHRARCRTVMSRGLPPPLGGAECRLVRLALLRGHDRDVSHRRRLPLAAGVPRTAGRRRATATPRPRCPSDRTPDLATSAVMRPWRPGLWWAARVNTPAPPGWPRKPTYPRTSPVDDHRDQAGVGNKRAGGDRRGLRRARPCAPLTMSTLADERQQRLKS